METGPLTRRPLRKFAAIYRSHQNQSAWARRQSA
jgi:hypothetical protein